MPGGSRPNSDLTPVSAGPDMATVAAGIVDVPTPSWVAQKSAEVGTQLVPIYATGTVSRGQGGASITQEYGPPIGYKYDNGKSQYVNFDTSGNLTGVESRGDKGLAPILSVALSIALPGIGEAIAASLVEAGVVTAGTVANTLGTAIASTAAQVAQGQSLDKALTNSIVNAVTSTGSQQVANAVNEIIGSPAVSNAIVSAAASAVKTAAAGGSADNIAQAATAGLVGSAAQSAYTNAVTDASPITGQMLGSIASGAVVGGIEGAGKSGVSTLTGLAGATPTTRATTTPVAEATSGQDVLTAFDEAAKEDYRNASTAFAGPAAALIGELPAAAAETQALLARLASTPAGQEALRQAASASERIRQAIVATGIISAGALSGFIGGQSLVPKAQSDMTTRNPGFDLIPTTGGDPGTAAAARTTFAQTDPRLITADAVTELEPVTVEVQRVAQNLGITRQQAIELQNSNRSLFNLFSQSDLPEFTAASLETMPLRDRLMLENMLAGNTGQGGVYGTTTGATTPESAEPTASGENTVIAVDASTGSALIMSSTGVVSTVKVEPNTTVGSIIVYNPDTRTVLNPTTNVTTSSDTGATVKPTTTATTSPTTTATEYTDQQILDAIRESIAQGFTPEQIAEGLARYGVDTTRSTQLLDSVKPTTTTTTSPTTVVNPDTQILDLINPTTKTTTTPTTSVAPTTKVQPTSLVEPTTSVQPTTLVEPTTFVQPTTSVQPTTTTSPTLVPPTVRPTTTVTTTPTPTVFPTVVPTIEPTVQTIKPTTTVRPTTESTYRPTDLPTVKPTPTFTIKPTIKPTVTSTPTPTTTIKPTTEGSPRPTVVTVRPTVGPTTGPTSRVLSDALKLSAYRGAGEIEDPSTGKPRKNVWNEESLRLKDALGI